MTRIPSSSGAAFAELLVLLPPSCLLVGFFDPPTGSIMGSMSLSGTSNDSKGLIEDAANGINGIGFESVEISDVSCLVICLIRAYMTLFSKPQWILQLEVLALCL